ncbi:MAG: 23S rRNA methyltransferase [Granulosicoccus sp.]|nr:23S rRNA methyltransferase [Granulosicoccus sp.]
MGRAGSKSSHRWLQEHASDQYVKQAALDGYRSRAVYKLIELDGKDRLIAPGSVILELGAAPGGWTQYLSRQAGSAGRIVATDILAMDSLPDICFVQGDFTEQATADAIALAMGNREADLVLSDMAPNLSGIGVSDQARAMGLVELALEAAMQFLNPQGAFVVKVLQGEGFDSYMQQVRKAFRLVKVRKPAASRARSREVYVVARNLI